MNQSQVQELYLRIIDATIEGVRAEFNEKAVDEKVVESLSLLQSRWTTRLTHTHEFQDDPTIIEKSSAAATKAAKKAKGSKKKPAGSASSPTNRNGGISGPDLTNKSDETKPTETAAESGQAAGVLHRKKEEHTVVHDGDNEPAAKRRRHETNSVNNDPDDGTVDHGGESLDSDDTDDENGKPEEQAENMVLAQHERVKKGAKWKVILREGIVSVRGREYLFHKASCDLEF